jgi:hypothetical protein
MRKKSAKLAEGMGHRAKRKRRLEEWQVGWNDGFLECWSYATPNTEP